MNILNKILKTTGLTAKDHRRRLKDKIKSAAKSGKTLDIGAGFYNKEQYYSYFEDITTLNVKAQSSMDIDVIADAHSLPFADGTFDNVLCTEVLEHLHSPQLAIDEIYRVLKTGGRLILSTPFTFPLHDLPNDYFRYTPFGLKHLCRQFKTIKVEPISDTFQTFYLVGQRIVYQADWGRWKFFKIIFLILLKILTLNRFFIKQEYGDIQRKYPVSGIFSSGYFLIAEK